MEPHVLVERLSLEEGSDREEEGDDGFKTPPSSPVKENDVKAKNKNPLLQSVSKSGARSLARKGRTRAVRQVHHLKSRILELKDYPLTPLHSFLINDWTYELDTPDELSTTYSPKENASILLTRAICAIKYFEDNFKRVSNPYFGKSVNVLSRFNKHKNDKKKENEMIVMITLAVLSENDIPEADKERYDFSVDAWGFVMERLLINAAKRAGYNLYEGTSDVGGGGKAGSDDSEYVSIYLLLSISNED